jgi:plastocyanin
VLVVVFAVLAIGAAAQNQPGKITRIEFQPATTEEGGGVFISLVGSGSCSYVLDYGDGQNERRTAELPDRVRHNYPADGEYLVVATPEAPCEGTARAKLDVRAINRGVWGLSAEPGPDPTNAEMLITITGRGQCAVTMDYGDGAVDKLTVTLPATHSHTYGKPGTYELKAAAEPPCRGEAALKVEIKREARRMRLTVEG